MFIDKMGNVEQNNTNGVPNMMLIDKSGKIVFRGHPEKRKNIDKDIDMLIKGETITGPGTQYPNISTEKGINDLNK